MTALYIALGLIVVVAFAGMVPLRRTADRSWRRHQVLRPMAKDLVRIQIQIVDRLTPALQQMAAAMEKALPAIRRLGDALRKDEL